MRAAAGLTFRETMAGGFSLGEADPGRGAEGGRRAGTQLELHATVAIADVQRFVADPSHAAALDGYVTFDPLGRALPGRGGTVKLFARGSLEAPKVMVYELPLATASGPFYLAGHKRVGLRTILHSWAETTTLYCRLHEGTNAGGPVAGAGILLLTPWAFVRQLTSFRTLCPEPSATARVAPLWRFGRYFAGELWSTYVR
jgi:hypothetical protein